MSESQPTRCEAATSASRKIFITVIIAAVGWISGVAGLGMALASERGEYKQIVTSNERRIVALEAAVKMLPVIQRDVEWIRESIEKRTTP